MRALLAAIAAFCGLALGRARRRPTRNGNGSNQSVRQLAFGRGQADPQLRHLDWLVELPQTELGICR
jgi:hypothetical protein